MEHITEMAEYVSAQLLNPTLTGKDANVLVAFPTPDEDGNYRYNYLFEVRMDNVHVTSISEPMARFGGRSLKSMLICYEDVLMIERELGVTVTWNCTDKPREVIIFPEREDLDREEQEWLDHMSDELDF